VLIADNLDKGVSVKVDPAELPTEILIDYMGTDPAIDAELQRRLNKPSATATAFHLPGKHDQHTHGRKGPIKFYSTGSGTADDPVKTNDADVAAQALGEGKYVQLDSTRQISTLLSKLYDIGQDAQKKGVKAPKYNLCKVSVPKTNLFCADTKGVPRIEMPQFRGVPRKGSPADSLPKITRPDTVGEGGKVDVTQLFLQHLRDQGVTPHDEIMDASYMKATQNELDGVKIAGMMKAMQEGKLNAREGFVVSHEGYIVDGHHMWAAGVALEYTQDKPVEFPVQALDMDILDILDEANRFTESQGLPHQEHTTRSQAFHLPGQHDQKTHGRRGAKAEHHARQGMGDIGISEDLAKDFQGGSAEKYLVHNDDGTWSFTPERQALHDRLIQRQLAGKTKPEGRAPTFVMMGGGSAAGKGTLVASGKVDELTNENTVKIDPDEFKFALPEFRLTEEAKAAAFTHEESSYLAKRLQAASLEHGYDTLLDSVGNSAPAKLRGKMQAAKEAGYAIHGHYVTVPIKLAMERARLRGQKTGRYIPDEVLISAHAGVSKTFPEVYKDFDEVQIFDTSASTTPKRIMHWDGQNTVVDDPTGWDNFLRKAEAA
jgi:predicted ABC-type ATPase